MKRTSVRILLAVMLVVGGGAYYYVHGRATTLVLSGIVTTNDTIVSAQVPGQIGRLLVKEGDVVTAGQVLAELVTDELRADRAYYAQAAEGAGSGVREGESALRFQEKQAAAQVTQAEAALAAAEAGYRSGQADLERAKLTFERAQGLRKAAVMAAGEFDQARTDYDAQTARVAALSKQADSARAAVALAQSNADQVAMRRSQLEASRHQSAAALAQQQKADVRLKYGEVRAPIAGIVDVQAARQGEVVAAAQPIVTLVNPDDLWVRADVEETYIDRVRIGDRMMVRLPSGAECDGVVFFRGVDAGFATQRDVSRTKRDIKTFEIRLRVDNADRRLALGMTAYVLLPVGK